MYRRMALTATFAASVALAMPATTATAHGGWGGHQRCPPRVTGMTIVESNRSFDDTWNTVIDTLDANPNIGIVATLDHAANASSVGLELGPTREVFFGNPNLGTPIMQASQTAGIDLPQKFLVWEDRRGGVSVGYNDPSYVAARHDAADAPTLDTIAGALANIAAVATDTDPDDDHRRRRCGRWGSWGGWGHDPLRRVARRPGLVFVDSAHDVDTTFERLIATIEAAPPNILFTLEHDRNAARVGLDLAPTKLIVFGNPVLGTPLMQRRQSTGIDLPQKFLVFERADGTVQIAYNDPRFVAKRHGVRGERATLETIAGALAGLAATAAAAD